MVEIKPLKRRGNLATPDPVLIRFRRGVVAGVEVKGRLFHFQYSDIPGQKPVDGLAQIGGRDAVLQIENCDLRKRVDPRVGPSRSHYIDRLAFNFGNDGLDNRLDGHHTGLNLPAVVICAVVSQNDFDSPHRRACQGCAGGREPGFTTGTPSRQRGQFSGGYVMAWSVDSATRGTPMSTCPPLRSM